MSGAAGVLAVNHHDKHYHEAKFGYFDANILNTMSYTVLARRYRSRTFEDVVGQEHISRTLKAAIQTNRVAHAYLFCGTRGVGKTSMARIFAAALCAPDTFADLKPHKELKSDAPQEVQKRLAESILAGTDDLDVIEIDGASNNRVEEARDLIAKASIVGSGRSRFKIYIVDEVHMLTTQAFNALLKTMEEPPEHVKFILCTTEPHKVPATIQSRCQRFDFRNISTASIASHLKSVLESEKIKADPAVVHEIARLGAGSMRDALSLLDRLIAAGEKTLTEELLQQMLGLPSRRLVTQLVDAFIESDVRESLKKADELLAGGFAIDQVFEILLDHLRNLMIASACDVKSGLLELADEETEIVARQADQYDVAALSYMIVITENAQRQCKISSAARALFDATIARLAMTEHIADLPRLIKDLKGGDIGSTKKASRPVAVNENASRPPSVTATKVQSFGLDNIVSPQPDPSDSPQPGVIENNLSTVWQRVVDLASPSPAIKGMLTMLKLVEIKKDQVHLLLSEKKSEEYVRRWLGRVEKLFTEVLGRPVTINLSVADNSVGEDSVAITSGRLSPELRSEIEQLPVVRTAMELFNATVVAVRNIEKNTDSKH